MLLARRRLEEHERRASELRAATPKSGGAPKLAESDSQPEAGEELAGAEGVDDAATPKSGGAPKLEHQGRRGRSRR